MAFEDCGVERAAAAGSPEALAGVSGEERNPATGDWRRVQRRRAASAAAVARTARNNQSQARRGPRLPALRGPRGHRLGSLARTFAFSLQSCGRTFNALTKTAMAHLRKKERWLDHARAMIEGKSLAKTAQLCGVHPTTAFRWRHRFSARPPVTSPEAERIVEADETFVLNPSRAAGPICRARRASEAERQGIRAFIRTTFPSLSPATGKARLSTRSCLKLTALR